jgi:FMN reductase
MSTELVTQLQQPVPVILCVGGSTRPDSSSEKALYVAAAAASNAGAVVECITGRDLILPIYDTERTERAAEARRLLSAVEHCDGLIVSSPGYHGTVSGMLKNALDYLEDLRDRPRPYLDGLPVGCIAVAHGWQATVSTLNTLRTTVHALRGWPSPLGAAVNAAIPVFAADGSCVDDSTNFQLQTLGTQVVQFAAMRLAQKAISNRSNHYPIPVLADPY